MASTTGRRPLPALVALLALLILTGLVWWRVLNRDTHVDSASTPCPTVTPAVVLPAPSTVHVVVLNSTSRVGIATKARSSLVDAGFNVPAMAANDNLALLNKITTTAQIRYGPAGAQNARLVHYYFPGAALVRTATPSKIIVVSLGTKYNGVATAAAVKARLARDHAIAGPPAPLPSGAPCPGTTATTG